MKCRKCGKEVVFVQDRDGERTWPPMAWHADTNLQDHNHFRGGARVVEVSEPTARRLRRQLEDDCENY